MSHEDPPNSSQEHSATPPSTGSIPHWTQQVFRALQNNGWWGFILGLVINAFKFTGAISMIAAQLLMALAFFVTVGVTWESERFASRSRRSKVFTIFLIIVVFAVFDALMVYTADHHEKRSVGFLQFNEIDIYRDYSFIGPGREFGGDVSAINASHEPVKNAYGQTKTYIEKADDHTDQRVKTLFEQEITPNRKQYVNGAIQGPEIGIGKRIRGTITTRALTADEAEGILNGTIRIYFASWWAWTTLDGHKNFSYDCRWLQAYTLPHPTYKKENIVWHYCSVE